MNKYKKKKAYLLLCAWCQANLGMAFRLEEKWERSLWRMQHDCRIYAKAISSRRWKFWVEALFLNFPLRPPEISAAQPRHQCWVFLTEWESLETGQSLHLSMSSSQPTIQHLFLEDTTETTNYSTWRNTRFYDEANRKRRGSEYKQRQGGRQRKDTRLKIRGRENRHNNTIKKPASVRPCFQVHF